MANEAAKDVIDRTGAFTLPQKGVLRRTIDALPEGGSVSPGSLISDDADNAIITGSDGLLYAPESGGGGGQVDEVVSGTGIDVDDADPEAPVVSLAQGVQDALVLAENALQSGDDVSELSNDAGYITTAQAPVVTLPGDEYDLYELTPGAWHEFTSGTAVVITVDQADEGLIPEGAEFGIMVANGNPLEINTVGGITIVPPIGGTTTIPSQGFALLKKRGGSSYKLAGETESA